MTAAIDFLIAGAQKAGTTALASYLAAHPAVRLPRGKEAHVFDAPDLDDEADHAAVNARFEAHFEEPTAPGIRRGDATPITLFDARFIARAHRHAPLLRWIVLLREPVERAISHWHMERARGIEPWPLWRAVLAEPRRLRAAAADWSLHSPMRWASYAARSDYAPQLRALCAVVPCEQILLLRSDDLASRPAEVVAEVLRFIGLEPGPGPEAYPRVFAGGYRPVPLWSPGRRLLAWRLRDARQRWRTARTLQEWIA